MISGFVAVMHDEIGDTGELRTKVLNSTRDSYSPERLAVSSRTWQMVNESGAADEWLDASGVQRLLQQRGIRLQDPSSPLSTILVLAHSVRALWLPIRHSLQINRLAGLSLSQRVRIDKTLIVVGDLLPGMAQMRHVVRGGRGKWRAGGQGILMTGRFQTDQIACRQGSEELGVSESPFRTELWVQSTEKPSSC